MDLNQLFSMADLEPDTGETVSIEADRSVDLAEIGDRVEAELLQAQERETAEPHHSNSKNSHFTSTSTIVRLEQNDIFLPNP